MIFKQRHCCVEWFGEKSFHFVRSHDETLKFIIVDVDVDIEGFIVKMWKKSIKIQLKSRTPSQKRKDFEDFNENWKFLLLKLNFNTLRAHLQIFLVWSSLLWHYAMPYLNVADTSHPLCNWILWNQNNSLSFLCFHSSINLEATRFFQRHVRTWSNEKIPGRITPAVIVRKSSLRLWLYGTTSSSSTLKIIFIKCKSRVQVKVTPCNIPEPNHHRRHVRTAEW